LAVFQPGAWERTGDIGTPDTIPWPTATMRKVCIAPLTFLYGPHAYAGTGHTRRPVLSQGAPSPGWKVPVPGAVGAAARIHPAAAKTHRSAAWSAAAVEAAGRRAATARPGLPCRPAAAGSAVAGSAVAGSAASAR